MELAAQMHKYESTDEHEVSVQQNKDDSVRNRENVATLGVGQ